MCANDYHLTKLKTSLKGWAFTTEDTENIGFSLGGRQRPGEIILLAMRDRIRLNRIMDRDKLIPEAIGTATEVSKGEWYCPKGSGFWPMVVSPSAKKESSLCALCASVVKEG